MPSILSNILSLFQDYFFSNDVNILLLFLVVLRCLESCSCNLLFFFGLLSELFLKDLGRSVRGFQSSLVFSSLLHILFFVLCKFGLIVLRKVGSNPF